MYSAFPDRKDHKTMGKLGEMQAKAQLDALKRFIQSMESEIVDKKRIAQEQRKINGNFDGRVKRENNKRAKESKHVADDIQNQIQLKSSLEKVRAKKDRDIPDIAGEEGYPRIYQRNQQQERSKTIKENEFIASELTKQMTTQKAWKDHVEMENAEIDRQYLTGWGYKKDAQDQHYATSGNLGKMAGPNR